MEPENAFFEVPGYVEGYDMDALNVDEAYLSVSSDANEQLYLYALNKDCLKCPYQQIDGSSPISPFSNSSSVQYTLSTRFGWDFLVSTLNTIYLDPSDNTSWSIVCEFPDTYLGEFGVYNLTVDDDADCTLTTIQKPVFIYGGLILMLLVYLLLAGIVYVLPIVIKKLNNTGMAMCFRRGLSESQANLDVEISSPKDEEPEKPKAKPRLKSLDTFRGLSIAMMIFVDYGGGRYFFLDHATWDGILVADLVFPWFLWIMGVCIPMGQRSAVRRNVPTSKIFWRIFKRSVKLFMLGIMLNSLGGYNELATYRVPGVLQRFAFCYLVVASASLFLPKVKAGDSKWSKMFSDVIELSWQWLLYAVIVVLHIIIMFCLPVPGCPTGYIGPGGVTLMDESGEPKKDCIGGASGYVDKWILGVEHLYQNPTAKFVYDTAPYDPEGVLSSTLSLFQVFLGLAAGMVLHHHTSDKARMVRWTVWGVLCCAIGFILAFAGGENAVMPLNKNLWSLSFTLVTSGMAFLLLALFYLLIDKMHLWNASPLYQAGMNSIFLYCGHNIMYNVFPWHYVIGPMRTHVALLVECLWGTTLWVIMALYLHSINKFYTV